MKTYYFYIKGDINQEPISMIKAKNKTEAIRMFCFQKQLEEEALEVTQEKDDDLPF